MITTHRISMFVMANTGDSSIETLELLDGRLPPRVAALVAEWAALHRAELRLNWTTLATEGKFFRIAPLA
jgi:hypothetical protein